MDVEPGKPRLPSMSTKLSVLNQGTIKMPILEVEMVCDNTRPFEPEWAQRIADLAGGVFETARGQTWVKMRKLEHTGYAENGVAASETPSPVFVHVMKKRMGDPEEIQDEVKKLSKGIAEILGKPLENVHIIFDRDAVGRIAFGGEFVEGEE